MKWLLALLLLCCLCLAKATRVSLVNNGYQDVVVAISSDIAEADGDAIIAKIKDLFTRGSSALYQATRNRAYFRDVAILVPSSWSAKPGYQPTTYETFDAADIKVDTPNPLYGDGPFTSQTGLCGERGNYIHLTPDFLKNLHGNSTVLFGEPGKVLVHEWAHLRYGVFDEFGIPNDPKYPVFYFDGKVLQPNSCSNQQLTGIYWDMTVDLPCEYDSNGRPDEHCRFIPDMTNNGATTSILSMLSLPNVHLFCDSSVDHKHNNRAPNKQNEMCNGRSTWEVILDNEDFKNKNLPAQISSTTPNFRIVQERQSVAFSLVLDVSGSMASDNRIGLLYDSASRWLKYELKLGNAVGIIKFSDGSSVLQNMVLVNSEAVKNQLISRIPKSAGGNTCIGCGLRDGVRMLQGYQSTGGGIIVLLTDGGENRSPYMKDVTNEIVNAKIKVMTIAFTAQADPKIETLASRTGGMSFFVDLRNPTEKLNAAFFEISKHQITRKGQNSIKLHETRYLTSSVQVANKFVIDSTIGKNTAVDFVYKARAQIKDINIIGSQKTYTLKDATEDTVSKLIRFGFADLNTGKYEYKITTAGTANQEIITSVVSEARSDKVKPIVTTCWTDIKKDAKGNQESVGIYAQVKQGNAPVLNARVIAKVDRPNGQPPVEIQLLDNGNGAPDVVADDGVYSRYFTQFVGKGRYSVQATAVDTGLSIVQTAGFRASQTMPLSHKFQIPHMSVSSPVKTGAFERVVAAGSFQMEREITNATDIFPPSQIRDLLVYKMSPKTGSIILQWTSPGDDLDQGTVSGYDLRYSLDFDDLQKQFNFSTPISVASLNILAGGEVVQYNLTIPAFQHNQTYYFALKAVDHVGHWSKISNIAQINIPPVKRMPCIGGKPIKKPKK